MGVSLSPCNISDSVNLKMLKSQMLCDTGDLRGLGRDLTSLYDGHSCMPEPANLFLEDLQFSLDD